MILDGGTFNLPGIEISLDYQREDEGQANFYTRGVGPNRFNFGQPSGGDLRVEFSLDDGSGIPLHINSGAIYAIPNDDIYRTYVFRYDPCTAIAEVLIDNDVIYTYIAAPGSVLYWEPASNVVIGDLMDAYGYNETLIDNLEISAANNLLPVELTNFVATSQEEAVLLTWETANEKNTNKFLVERSLDGVNFETIAVVQSAGNSNIALQYSFLDESPDLGTSYYRLKQLDLDGSSTYSALEVVHFSIEQDYSLVTFPNPMAHNLNVQFDQAIDEDAVTMNVYDMQGQLVLQEISDINYKTTIDVQSLEQGNYVLRVITNDFVLSKKIQKQ